MSQPTPEERAQQVFSKLLTIPNRINWDSYNHDIGVVASAIREAVAEATAPRQKVRADAIRECLSILDTWYSDADEAFENIDGTYHRLNTRLRALLQNVESEQPAPDEALGQELIEWAAKPTNVCYHNTLRGKMTCKFCESDAIFLSNIKHADDCLHERAKAACAVKEQGR